MGIPVSVKQLQSNVQKLRGVAQGHSNTLVFTKQNPGLQVLGLQLVHINLAVCPCHFSGPGITMGSDPVVPNDLPASIHCPQHMKQTSNTVLYMSGNVSSQVMTGCDPQMWILTVVGRKTLQTHRKRLAPVFHMHPASFQLLELTAAAR